MVKDEDLLYLLSENARLKLKEIAKQLNKSPQRVKYNIDLLEEQGFIHNPYCIFDYSYFGMIVFKVYFKGAYITDNDKEKLISHLSNNSYVIAIYEFNGEYDLIVEIASPNPSRFNKEIKKIATENPKLNNYKVVLNLVTHIYPRTYLVKKSSLLAKVEHECLIGGDRDVFEFTDKELALIKELLENPQNRLIKIAENSGIDIRTTKKMILDLQKKRILQGFKFLFDYTTIDIHRVRLFLKLHNVNQERENKLLKYASSINEIILVNKTLGDWDMEIDMESMQKKRIRELVLEIRENFTDIIETFNITEFHQYYRRQYLPKCLFLKDKKKE